MAAAAVVLSAAIAQLPAFDDLLTEALRVDTVEEKVVALVSTDFKRLEIGTMRGVDVADEIERNLLPEMHRAQVRLQSVRVPDEQSQMATALRNYWSHRESGFRLLAEGLRENNMEKLAEAKKHDVSAKEALTQLSQ